jgi:thymidine phosphorylase
MHPMSIKTYFPQEIIRKKRDALSLSQNEIQSIVDGLCNESWQDSQISALAMAIFFNGMSNQECVALTQAMAQSGEVLNWSHLNLPGPLLDKHSTGGVGDKVTLILIPLLAACGAFLPKSSGRALGHTGGTLDKMASIAGYDIQPDANTLSKTLREVGCFIVGQTGNLAPADKKFYAIRDITATVESIPLITASILSKKIASGSHNVIFDVKFGNGAFFESIEQSEQLAQNLANVAHQANLSAVSVMTDMNEPLGTTIGNALEVEEAIAFLTGQQQNKKLHQVIMTLGKELLCMSKLCDSPETAEQKLLDCLESGQAAERFAKMVAALGGPNDIMENTTQHLPQAKLQVAVPAPQSGYIQQIDTRQLGLAVNHLGAGRQSKLDLIDLSVGLSEVTQLGSQVEAQAPLAMVHARSEEDVAAVSKLIQNAYHIANQPLQQKPVIYKTLYPES